MLILTLIVDEFNTNQQFKDNEMSGMSDVGLQEDSGRDSDGEVDGPVPTCFKPPWPKTIPYLEPNPFINYFGPNHSLPICSYK